jgi:predicted CopG family antitoxin
MSAEKQIRVSEDVRDELHGMKGVGDSYDDVLRQLVQEHNRRELAGRMTEAERMDAEDLVPLE